MCVGDSRPYFVQFCRWAELNRPKLDSTVLRQQMPAEEGLHGVHKRLRRDKHPKSKEGCNKFSGKQAVTQRGQPQESLCARDMTRGSAGRTVSPNTRSVDSTWEVHPAEEEEEGLHGVHKRLRRDKHPKT
jgi:hypothetical protein